MNIAAIASSACCACEASQLSQVAPVAIDDLKFTAMFKISQESAVKELNRASLYKKKFEFTNPMEANLNDVGDSLRIIVIVRMKVLLNSLY